MVKKYISIILAVLFSSSNAFAILTSASIPAPVSVAPDGATNQRPQGFNEQQNIRLPADLVVDNGIIPAGTVVNSHMIFLNPGPSNTINFNGATFRFDGDILGVMSDTGGQQEADSSALLGAIGTTYPAAYTGRGLETGTPLFPFGTENYNVSGDTFRLSLRAGRGEGDYIRVITTSNSPECVRPEYDVLVCNSGCDFSTIQAGINAAENSQIILALAGDYQESIVLSGGKTLLSCEGAEATIIDASGLDSRVVALLGGATINGFTIKGGVADAGAGIHSSGGTIINNIITDNISTGNGGGIAVRAYSSTVIRHNTIANNSAATRGGGLINAGYSTIEFEDNLVEGNQAIYGGGVFFSPYGSFRFEGNRVKGNSATYGGGILTPGYSRARIINSIVTNNEATVIGGGIYSSSYSGARIVNSTLSGNVAPVGAAVGTSSYSGVSIANTIMWDNTGQTINRPRYGAARIVYSIIQNGYPGTGNLDIDPEFNNPAAGNFGLQSGSPAIDTGANPDSVVKISVIDDFFDNIRPQDGDGQGAGSTGDGSDYDIGAVETVATN